MATRSRSSRRRARFIFAAAALGFGLARPAWAAAPDDAAKERARELMAQGRKARAGADLQAALESFRQADEIMHVPTTSLEVAKALKDLGRLVEAATALERIDAVAADAGEPGAFVQGRRAAADLRLELDARIPRLRISASPADAAATHLTLDGKPIEAGAAESGLRVDPGRHVATAERRGSVQQRVVQLAEGGSADVTFDFGAPPELLSAPRSRPAKTANSSYLLYGLGGLAVAGIGTGVGLAVWSNQRKGVLERDCSPHCPASQVTDLRIGYVAANVTTAVGVAAGLAALTIYFVRSDHRAPKRDSARAWSLAASPAPGAPRVTLVGTF